MSYDSYGYWSAGWPTQWDGSNDHQYANAASAANATHMDFYCQLYYYNKLNYRNCISNVPF